MQKIKNYLNEFKDQYTKNDSWVEDYFEEEKWFGSTSINIRDFELMTPDSSNNYDLENTRILYSSMKNLKPSQAVEERIWVYLTHTKFWDYMRKRWPAERYLNDKKNFEARMKERYFFSSKRKRALFRNGISRLWWFGHLTYEEDRANPFRLTEIFLDTQDTAESIIGRNFSNNRKITKSVLRVFEKWIDDKGGMPSRKVVRELCKHINYMGGVSVLDPLEESEIEKRVLDKLKYLNEKFQ